MAEAQAFPASFAEVVEYCFTSPHMKKWYSKIPNAREFLATASRNSTPDKNDGHLADLIVVLRKANAEFPPDRQVQWSDDIEIGLKLELRQYLPNNEAGGIGHARSVLQKKVYKPWFVRRDQPTSMLCQRLLDQALFVSLPEFNQQMMIFFVLDPFVLFMHLIMVGEEGFASVMAQISVYQQDRYSHIARHTVSGSHRPFISGGLGADDKADGVADGTGGGKPTPKKGTPKRNRDGRTIKGKPHHWISNKLESVRHAWRVMETYATLYLRNDALSSSEKENAKAIDDTVESLLYLARDQVLVLEREYRESNGMKPPTIDDIDCPQPTCVPWLIQVFGHKKQQ